MYRAKENDANLEEAERTSAIRIAVFEVILARWALPSPKRFPILKSDVLQNIKQGQGRLFHTEQRWQPRGQLEPAKLP